MIFDVGANVGGYSNSLIDSGLKIAQVFAFEPHPQTFSRLKLNTNKTGVVVPIQAALSDRSGEMLLFDRADFEGTSHASLSREIFSVVHKTENNQTTVNVDTLDSFCESNDIKRIDFLKIDVEGYELSVLRGACNMLANQKIVAVQTPANAAGVSRHGRSA